jgi:hypothetical protein
MTTLPAETRCYRLASVRPAVSFIDLVTVDPPLVLTVLTDEAWEPEASESVPEEVRRLSAAFARAILEGLTGRRNAHQFGDRISASVLGTIRTRAMADRAVPPFSASSMRVQLVHDAAAEVTLRLTRGGRSVPAAFRLDRRRGAWRCTALVVGP